MMTDEFGGTKLWDHGEAEGRGNDSLRMKTMYVWNQYNKLMYSPVTHLIDLLPAVVKYLKIFLLNGTTHSHAVHCKIPL